MNYQRIYDDLISFRQINPAKGYVEKHHIQMRSLGGSDEETNLVKLTAREHYIAHLLLHKILQCQQSACALSMMSCGTRNNPRPHIKSSRMYEWARKEFAKYISRNAKITSKGERNSQHGTRWICNVDLKENRKISKTDELPQGWILGRNKWRQYKEPDQFASLTSLKKSLNVRGSNNPQFGKFWINDGNSNKLVSEHILGWAKGRLM